MPHRPGDAIIIPGLRMKKKKKMKKSRKDFAEKRPYKKDADVQDGRKEVYEEFRMLLVGALFAVIKHKRDNEKTADSAEGDVTMFEVEEGPESVLERTYDTFQEKIRKMMLEDNLMCSLFSKGKGQILRVSAALWLLFHAVDKPDKVFNSLDSGLSLPTVIPERVVSAAVADVTYSIHQTGLLRGRRHNEDAGTVDNSTTDVPHLESASTSRRTTNFGGQTLSGSILLVPGRVLSVKNLLTKRFFKTRGKKEVADTMLAMQDQHLGEVKTLSHRGGQRVYFVKHDILGLPDADKTAAIVALAQHGVNIKEYADTLVDSEAEGDMNKSIEANEVIAGEKRELCAASTMLSPLCDADDDDDFAPTTNKRRSI
ncbi:uncharacterized protein [Branchiostoma lanceolatum]|uniref:uncharacterized protein n=1 Tax=Branchiostoma lanceolatum TaxID=7740 RepID=UPI0034544B5A